MNLSKSRYTLCRQCPKALWLSVNKPEEAAETDESRMVTGQQVGQLAKGWLGSYKEATKHKKDGSLDIQAMIDETKRLMADESVQNICEAAFLADGCYCAVDILHREKDGWAIYEVKSSSMRDEEGHVDEKKADEVSDVYIWDIAYQKYVLQQCKVHVTGTYLVCLNKEYVRNGALDIKQLFVSKDVSEQVLSEYPLVAKNCEKAKAELAQVKEPGQKLHAGCQKPYECAFKQYCMKPLNIPEHSVFNMYRMWWTKKIDYFGKGICTLEQLQKVPKLNEHHKLQVACDLNNTDYINKDAIRAWLKKNIRYPLYHLDFETVQYAVPQYEGTHPYQQIPFQYSLHIEPAQGANCEHREFLADANSANPMRQLAEQLCKDIPADKCVLVYNQKFEKGRLAEMAAAFPDLHDHLMAIHDNIVDLLIPFQKWYYYRPAMNGSFSIKKVLPALFPNDPTLDYHNLPGTVHNGGEAMDIFPRMRNMSGKELEDARHSLLVYCGLDTWSMVVILRRLYDVSTP